MPRGRGRVLRGGIAIGGSLKCDFCVLSVPAAVGHRFMSILTRPNRQEPLAYAEGAVVTVTSHDSESISVLS